MRTGSKRRVFHGWWVVLVAFLAMFAATPTGGSGFSVFVLPMVADLGWSRATLAQGLFIGTILGAVAAPFFGRLVDRFGARVMLTATGLGLAVTLLPIAWVKAPLFFYLCYSSARVIDMGVLNTAAATAVANWFVRLRGRALGLTMAGNAIGVALVTPLAQWIIVNWGWRMAWFALSLAVVAILTPLAWWLVRRRPEDLGLHPDGDPGPPDARMIRSGGRAGPPIDWSAGAALRTASFWLLVVSFSIVAFAGAGMNFHQIPVLVENGLDPSAAAWLVGLYGFGWTIGSVTWGVVAERVPARYALAVNNLLAGACILAVVGIHDVTPAIVYAALYGLTNGGREALDAVVWADYYGRRSVGAIRGYSRPLIVGANAGGGLAAGLAYDSLGSYAAIITAFGLATIAGGLLVVLARPPLARRAQVLPATAVFSAEGAESAEIP